VSAAGAATALAAAVESHEEVSGPENGAQRARKSYPCGTRAAYSVGGCRCAKCRQAMADYSRLRYREMAYGRWQANEPAAASEAQIKAWHAAGFTLRDLIQATGLPEKVISDLLYGLRKSVRGVTAQAIREAQPTRIATSRIPAVGSMRRLQALTWVGWPLIEVSARSGVSKSILSQARGGHRRMLAYGTHQSIVAVFDELWDQAPPDNQASRDAAARARREGWAPPAAWDDDTIDDPRAKPFGLVREGQATGPASTDPMVLERIAELHRVGYNDREIATRLGYNTPDAVAALRRRHLKRDAA